MRFFTVFLSSHFFEITTSLCFCRILSARNVFPIINCIHCAIYYSHVKDIARNCLLIECENVVTPTTEIYSSCSRYADCSAGSPAGVSLKRSLFALCPRERKEGATESATSAKWEFHADLRANARRKMSYARNLQAGFQAAPTQWGVFGFEADIRYL